jgi:hypothetical protein
VDAKELVNSVHEFKCNEFCQELFELVFDRWVFGVVNEVIDIETKSEGSCGGRHHWIGCIDNVACEEARVRCVVPETKAANSLAAKSVLAGEKLVPFGRYILNFYVGIVHYILRETKTQCANIYLPTQRTNWQILTSAKKIQF